MILYTTNAMEKKNKGVKRVILWAKQVFLFFLHALLEAGNPHKHQQLYLSFLCQSENWISILNATATNLQAKQKCICQLQELAYWAKKERQCLQELVPLQYINPIRIPHDHKKYIKQMAKLKSACLGQVYSHGMERWIQAWSGAYYHILFKLFQIPPQKDVVSLTTNINRYVFPHWKNHLPKHLILLLYSWW